MVMKQSKQEEETKIVFVSGGSRGIGAGIAIELAEAGYDIWLNYKSSTDAAMEVKDTIEKMGRSCTLLPFDVSDEAAATKVLEPLLDKVVPYGMVHNAGIARDNIMPLMQRKEWDQVIDVHLNSFFILGRLFSKMMLGKRRGRIISIASISGETGQAGQIGVHVAKCMNELADFKSRNLRNHHQQQRIARNVEGHTEKNICATLIQSKIQLVAVCYRELERGMTKRRHLAGVFFRCHGVDEIRIPG